MEKKHFFYTILITTFLLISSINPLSATLKSFFYRFFNNKTDKEENKTTEKNLEENHTKLEKLKIELTNIFKKDKSKTCSICYEKYTRNSNINTSTNHEKVLSVCCKRFTCRNCLVKSLAGCCLFCEKYPIRYMDENKNIREIQPSLNFYIKESKQCNIPIFQFITKQEIEKISRKSVSELLEEQKPKDYYQYLLNRFKEITTNNLNNLFVKNSKS